MKVFTITFAFFFCFQVACKNARVVADELAGGYGFEANGTAQINISKEDGDYYLQMEGLNSKSKMSPVPDSDAERILGTDWQNIKIDGLTAGAFFLFKVKPGSMINGQPITSGYYGSIPAGVEIWKVK